MDNVLEGIKEAIISREAEQVVKLTQKALDEGISAEKIVFEAGTPAMEIVGQEYDPRSNDAGLNHAVIVIASVGLRSG